ncbi:RNA polymerase sigma factor SigJ [Streptomyces sp. NPDC058459]|uniref:RNA polymerase sigma factor SigJ n=1 Tax=Streptomyces sp. NPDC058459 TaxID=3346508 RepID=UPI00365C418A
MSPEEREAVQDEVLGARRHLLALAFRMLGTVAEAEDAVQETYVRWFRLTDEERDAIKTPRAWLTRAAGRVCLNVLDSARVRRERYAGPWLPEPIPAYAFATGGSPAGDPAERAALDDSISTALLVVLESMTPAERVSFVLHDVFALPFDDIAGIVGRSSAACRQLAASARRRVEQDGNRSVSRAEHDKVVRAFAAAARSADLAALIAVLDPRVVLRSDGGGRVSAARRPVFGADRVARFLFGALERYPGTEVRDQQTSDGLGLALWSEGRITGVATLDVLAGLVTDLRLMMNPDKLTLWRRDTG